MKPLPLIVALLAVSQPQCPNPLAPTTVSGPRSPGEYCAQFVGAFGEAFYCYSAQGNTWDPNMPSNWGGYCMQATMGLGNAGYSAVTASGRRFPVVDQATANSYCDGLARAGASDRCTSVIRCTR